MNDSEVKISILRYLCAYPDAEDTLEGITFWWIMRDRSGLRARQVRKAALQLVREGLLIEKRSATQGPVYAVNRERLPDIRALVKCEQV